MNEIQRAQVRSLYWDLKMWLPVRWHHSVIYALARRLVAAGWRSTQETDHAVDRSADLDVVAREL